MMRDFSENLRRILFVVVSCTRDPSRAKPFRALIESINDEHRRVGFERNLMLFDNASTIQDPLDAWEAPAIFAMCPENVGYWSALKWSLENAKKLFGRQFEFVHPIESDLVLYNLERLSEAVDFLDLNLDVESVRTQEFSVSHKRRYFKGAWTLFPCRRSRVADYNGVTQEKVRFRKADGFERIFLTNWHSKVPALHRFDALLGVLETLAAEPSLTEFDFMRVMQDKTGTVGLLDGGVYFTTSYRPNPKELAGSYSDAAVLVAAGYRQTRMDRIEDTIPEPVIRICNDAAADAAAN